MKKILTLAFAVAVLFVSCGGKDTKKIVVASKPMTEQFIIGEMLVALIENETEIKVEHKQGIGGGTSAIHPAMESGEVDLYPEYTGTGWMFVLKQDLINDPAELYDAVKASYEEEYGFIWSDLYGFNDTYGIAMKRDLARELGIRTYTDLAARSGELTFGAEHDFFERDDAMPGISAVYGFDFQKEVAMDIGLKYQAIGAGEVDVINIFSTDGRLKEYDLVVLEDDRNFFPSYYCATLIREETLVAYPELEAVLEKMTGLIDNDAMTGMNYLVEIEKKQARDVARNFLTEKGLL